MEIISSYTDAQAVDDGTLVAINRKDRVTSAVWSFLAAKAPKDSKPPNCWPVAMMTWFQAQKISKTDALKLIAEYGKDGAQAKYEKIIGDRKALALASGLIDQRRGQAKRTYEENIGGGIFKVLAILSGDQLSELKDAHVPDEGTVLWLMPNDQDGITLMFPDDN